MQESVRDAAGLVDISLRERQVPENIARETPQHSSDKTSPAERVPVPEPTFEQGRETPPEKGPPTPERVRETVPEPTTPDTVPPVPKEPISPFIVVDQFGYLPNSEKIAVIRNPNTGYDAGRSFSPGKRYALVNATTGQVVVSAAPKPWNQGNVDPSSGDRAWWFLFSSVTTPGTYYVLDQERSVRSDVFVIGAGVYRKVLEQAVRTFFYQRSGFVKDVRYAGRGWADKASHLQDKKCRLYSAKQDASTERDLHGGWYDAGDYSKYTSWHAGYVVALLMAYRNAPKAFGDQTNIPESGNSIPDILDEVKWGMDWLIRMQSADGSVLSIVGADHASPPSAAKKPCYYGPANTVGTWNTAAAFALGATVFGAFPSLAAYATQLRAKAIKAYAWAKANPRVLFSNNASSNGSQGLGAGQQETDDYGRFTARFRAATYLFELTGQSVYKGFVDQEYKRVRIISSSWTGPFEQVREEALLYYARLPKATKATSDAIVRAYQGVMQSSHNFAAFRSERDPYMAYIKDYTWGSNSTKSSKGNMFLSLLRYNIAASQHQDARRAALRYVHYIHGVNPLGLVYLSNMRAFGAHNSVNEFYHAWFADGSALWDRVGTSTYGPAPGFLTGGPNPSYRRDDCCPNRCGAGNNAKCSATSISPPRDQPAQKSYKDFNHSWPLNSWSVTENSNGYQVAYIYLLSHFSQ